MQGYQLTFFTQQDRMSIRTNSVANSYAKTATTSHLKTITIAHAKSAARSHDKAPLGPRLSSKAACLFSRQAAFSWQPLSYARLIQPRIQPLAMGRARMSRYRRSTWSVTDAPSARQSGVTAI